MAKKKQPLKMFNYFFRINKIIKTLDSSNLSPEEQSIFNIYKAVFNISKSKLLFLNTKIKNDNIIILKKYQESASLINKTITNYFLAKVYYELNKSPDQAKIHYLELCKLYPNNKIFRTALDLCS